MIYREAIDYLLSFADFERSRQADRTKEAFVLERIQALLDRLARPESGRLTVHVAGSKGKGSAAAMIESILRAAGRRTGLYTSPHLYEFCERIRIDGQPISEGAFADLVTQLQLVIGAELAAAPGRLSTFEILTAMAYLAFRDAAVDAQVVEVGVGGRLDSTNVFGEKAAAVITAISREHVAVLGPDLESIAAEKAGIITPGTAAVILGPQRSPQAAAVVSARGEEQAVSLVDVSRAYRWERAGTDRHGQWFRIFSQAAPADQAKEALYLLPLMGLHQIENAVTAIATIDTLRAQGVTIDQSAVHTGLATVAWPARLEVLAEDPWLVVDAAHNDESFERVLESLRVYFPHDRLVLVLGMLRDKDVGAIAKRVLSAAAALVITQPDHPRALQAQELADAFEGFAGPVLVEPTVADAVGAARGLAGERDLVCVLGSIFLAAEARAHILRQAGGEPTSARAER